MDIFDQIAPPRSTSTAGAAFDVFDQIDAGPDSAAQQRNREIASQTSVDPNNIESPYMRAKRLQNERNPFSNYAAAVGQSIGQAGANVVGLFSPETGQRWGRNVDAYYGPNTGGASGLVGGTIGAAGQAIPALATGGMTAAGLLAAQFGAAGAGGVRREVADLRDAGQEVSGLEELGTAAGVGAVEAASGAISALMFGAFGKAAEGLMPAAKQAFATGGKQGLAAFMSRAAGTTGAALGEGLEEGATQYATGRIRQAGINEQIDPWEGVVESALTGVALSPILGPIAHGAGARSRARGEITPEVQAGVDEMAAKISPGTKVQVKVGGKVVEPTSETEQLFGPVTGRGEMDTAPKASQDAGASQTPLADLGDESGEYTAQDIQKYIGTMETGDGEAELAVSMMDNGPYVVVEAPVDAINANVLQAGDVDSGKMQDATEFATAGSTPPPVVVGRDMMIADGTHRLLAAKQAGKPTIGAVMSKAQAATLGLTPVNVRGGVSQQAQARQQAPVISTQPVKLPLPSAPPSSGFFGRVRRSASKGKRVVPGWLEDFITPVSSRIRDLSPKVFNRLMRMEFDTGTFTERIKLSMADSSKRLNDAERKHPLGKKLKMALLNQDYAGAFAIAKRISPTLVKDVEKVTKLMPSMHKMLTDAGVNVGKLEDYFPRFIKDHEAFVEAFQLSDPGRFQEAIDVAQKMKGSKPLTTEEKAEVINSVVQGFGPAKPGSRGVASARTRQIDQLTDDQAEFYSGIAEALNRYIDSAVYAAQRSEFLGKNHDLSQLDNTIGEIIRQEVEATNLSKTEQQELHDLLKARFTADMLKTNPFWRGFKQLTYATGLSNLASTVTQLTDLVFTAADYGMGKTLKTLFGGKRAKRLIREDLGIHEHGSEFRDPGKIAKATDWVLTNIGFKRFDRFGKEVRMNAALRSLESAAKNRNSAEFRRLERKYKPVLGNATFGRVMADLANGKINENVKYVTFLEVADVQPITLSQMPEKYLRNPNGRVLYTMKTFTLMQLDRVRREVLRKLRRPGERVEGLKNLGRYAVLFTITDMGIDLFKDWLRGKPISVDQIPDRAMDSMLALVGLNRYMGEKTLSGDVIGALIDWAMVPTRIVTDPAKDVRNLIDSDLMSGEEGVRSVRLIPFVGDLVYGHAPWAEGFKTSAAERKAAIEKKLKEVKDQVVEALTRGDTAGAEALVAVYNGTKPADKTALDIDDAESLMLGRQDRARRKVVIDAAEQMLQGNKQQAQSRIDEYNFSVGDDGDPIDITEAEDQAAEFLERGKSK